jgi:hypothetical protein
LLESPVAAVLLDDDADDTRAALLRAWSRLPLAPAAAAALSADFSADFCERL